MATKKKAKTGNTLLITNIILTIVIAVILWFLLIKSQEIGAPSLTKEGLSQVELKEIADLQTQLALEKAKLEQMAEQEKAAQLAVELAAEKERAKKLIEAQSSTDDGLASELNMQLEDEKKRIATVIAEQLKTSEENAFLLKELELTRGQNQTLNNQIQELMDKLMDDETVASTDSSTSTQSQENIDLLKAIEGDMTPFVSPEAQQQALLVAEQQQENVNNSNELEEGDKIPSSVYQLQAVVDNLNTTAIEDADDANKIPSSVYQLQAAVTDIMETETQSSTLENLAALVQGDQSSVEYLQALEQEAEVRQNEMRLITVQRGDTLSLMAQRAYGDPLKYAKIFAANPTVLSDPNKIYPGMRLRVPL